MLNSNKYTRQLFVHMLVMSVRIEFSSWKQQSCKQMLLCCLMVKFADVFLDVFFISCFAGKSVSKYVVCKMLNIQANSMDPHLWGFCGF